MKTTRDVVRTVLTAALLAATFMLGSTRTTAATYDAKQFAAYKRKALGVMEQRMSRIAESHQDDPALGWFMDRLKLIDKVGAMLVEGFQSAKTSTLDDILTNVVAVPPDASSREPVVVVMSAGDVLAEYQDAFAAGLPFPAVTKQEMAFLRRYYDATARAAGSYIAEHGRAFAAIDTKSAPTILELCLVMPFLHIPDEKWSAGEIESFAEWMHSARNLASIEDFALRVRRPFTAYHAAQCRRKKDSPADQREQSYAEYLRQAAARMVEQREYHAGIHCMKIGIERARATEKPEVIVALRFQLAEVLSKAGHSQLSAQEIKRILDAHPESTDWGKAAMLRLKYLYEAEQFDALTEEFPDYRLDKRCERYLPQLIYIAWVTHRRRNQTDQAVKLQAMFLKGHPRHPLAADMHFASAMTALAASDYNEALRSLEIIEYRYPKSRVAKKAVQIRQRLEKTLKPRSRKGG